MVRRDPYITGIEDSAGRVVAVLNRPPHRQTRRRSCQRSRVVIALATIGIFCWYFLTEDAIVVRMGRSSMPMSTATLRPLIRSIVDSGRVPPGTDVLYGDIDVRDTAPPAGFDPDTAARVGLYRGLLGQKPTRRWANDSHIVEALQRGCFGTAPWPLSTSNQICMTGGRAAEFVARSRRRTAFWPGDDKYRYVFHSVPPTERDALRAMIVRDLPLDALSAMFRVDLKGSVRSRFREVGRNTFYLGSRGTNSALHTHTAAINALVVGGPKIWITAPETSRDAIARFNYGRVTNQSTSDWLLANLEYLTANVPGLAIFVQREGDVVFLPHFTFHGTINLAFNVGSAFAFFPKRCNGVRGSRGGGCMDRFEDVIRAQEESMEACHACRPPEMCECRR